MSGKLCSVSADEPGADPAELFVLREMEMQAVLLVPILVEANIQASLSVAPPVLRMGNLKVGESVTRLAMVRANKPFHIVAIEGQGDGVVVEVPTAALQAQVLKIRFQPDKPGELRRQLRIKTDLDQESTASVTVEGIVEP